MPDTFNAIIDGIEIPGMTMEDAIDRCRQKCNDRARTVVLKAKVGKKSILLGTYEPMPVEMLTLKTITIEHGDFNACCARPVPPKKPIIYDPIYD